MFISGTSTYGVYKVELSNVKFSTTNSHTGRVQLSFGWVFWTESELTNLLVDVENRHVYHFVTTTAIDWEAGYEKCKAYNRTERSWEMTTINNRAENNLVKLHSAGNGIPLQSVRSADGAQFLWHNGDPTTFTDWEGSQPDDATAHCLELNTASSGWNDKACTTTYTKHACEVIGMDAVGVRSFILPRAVLANVNLQPPIQSGVLPSTDFTDTMYGATCNTWDRYLLTASHDDVHVTLETSCMLQVAGEATVQDYNTFVLGIDWRAIYNNRTGIDVGFVYWTDKKLREMVIDIGPSHVYASFRGTIKWTPVAGYNYESASSYCNVCRRNILCQ